MGASGGWALVICSRLHSRALRLRLDPQPANSPPQRAPSPPAAQLSESLDPLGPHHHHQAVTSTGE